MRQLEFWKSKSNGKGQMSKIEESPRRGPLPPSPLLRPGGELFLPFAVCHLNFEIL
jgi:hypothetical protein